MITTSDPGFERWAQESNSFEEEFEVIGTDSRVCVQDTTIPPHPYVCYITRPSSPVRDARGRRVTPPDKTWTGTLIGPRTVLTVAHWLYEKSTMKLVSRNNMYAVPGMNGRAATPSLSLPA